MARRRRRCPVCRSNDWHKEPSSGLIACSEGHILQSYRNEATDAGEEHGAHALRRRALKAQRDGHVKTREVNHTLYHGERARYLYFQCQQLILRQQISVLIKLWDLPPEFEVVCRDIWALHLRFLPEGVPAKPPVTTEGTVEAKNEKPLVGVPEKEKQDVVDGQEEETSSRSSSSDEEDDPVLKALMRENSESPSSSDASEDEDLKLPPNKQERLSRKQLQRYEGPRSTISVLMLACWIMRVPVMYRDFIMVIRSHKLPYFDPVVGLLPKSMTQHLNKYLVKSLSPQRVPDVLSLHRLTCRLARLCHSTYGILTPELNAAPMLWRVVRSLNGDPVLYSLAKKLSDVLSLSLTLHHTLAPKLERARTRDPERYRSDNVPPEVAFMAVVIVVLKIMHGLDGRPRHPSRTDDPVYVQPRLDDYLLSLTALDIEEDKAQDNVFSADRPMFVEDLSEGVLDEYLDFCEAELLAPEGNQHNDKDILGRRFPLSDMSARRDRATTTNRDETRPPLRAYLPRTQEVEGEVLRPGESYRIYDSDEVTGDELGVVIKRSAGWVYVGEGYLSQVVEGFERRLVRWRDREKRHESG